MPTSMTTARSGRCETMEYHKYACIPMLNRAGEYVGTITEGDLLWGSNSMLISI